MLKNEKQILKDVWIKSIYVTYYFFMGAIFFNRTTKA